MPPARRVPHEGGQRGRPGQGVPRPRLAEHDAHRRAPPLPVHHGQHRRRVPSPALGAEAGGVHPRGAAATGRRRPGDRLPAISKASGATAHENGEHGAASAAARAGFARGAGAAGRAGALADGLGSVRGAGAALGAHWWQPVPAALPGAVLRSVCHGPERSAAPARRGSIRGRRRAERLPAAVGGPLPHGCLAAAVPGSGGRPFPDGAEHERAPVPAAVCGPVPDGRSVSGAAAGAAAQRRARGDSVRRAALVASFVAAVAHARTWISMGLTDTPGYLHTLGCIRCDPRGLCAGSDPPVRRKVSWAAGGASGRQPARYNLAQRGTAWSLRPSSADRMRGRDVAPAAEAAESPRPARERTGRR
mmetsp:Transcript_19574/g.65746  ORF Transcript_19574/g.65746 Transcript_19574/m.65746 type:complete len:362 (-) Transcript_19574:372-1457(-)